MNVDTVNHLLSLGKLDERGLFPKVEELALAPYKFTPEIGLDLLPEEPGLITLRGPRQFGKSTWLEHQLKLSVEEYGPGSTYYLNGDEIGDAEILREKLEAILPMFSPRAGVKRILIDEITAVPKWEKALKRLIDGGELRSVLVVSTGSKCSDLRRGAERLPGRKGKLARTTYFFLPISYAEFKRVCGPTLGDRTLIAYLISGGSPVACSELALTGQIPEYVITMVRDWILGEFASSGRHRMSVLKIMELIHRHGGTPVGYSKIAREADLANNTVALGYLELLADLFCVIPGYAWDETRRLSLLRKPCKFQWINLLAAVTWSPDRIRSIADFEKIPPTLQGKWWEWLAAQELWRRDALVNPEPLISLDYWQGSEHEVDFVRDKEWYEIKRGATSPFEFKWFKNISCSGTSLKVVNTQNFDTERVLGITWEEFLQAP